MEITNYFLGANSANGFSSLFSELQDGVTRLRIIKGGPGCGKSTYMKIIANALEREGFEIERIYCGSDPGSLDGFRVRELSVAYVDGTPPHIVEPEYPAALETFVDMLNYVDDVSDSCEEMKKLKKEISQCHYRASQYVKAAGSVYKAIQSGASEMLDEHKLERKAVRLCEKYVPRQKNGNAKVRKCFLGAVTPDGIVNNASAAGKKYETVIVLKDGYGLCYDVLETVMKRGIKYGYDMICCMSPLFSEKIEHLIFPQLSLFIVSDGNTSKYEGTYTRRIRLDTCVRDYKKKTQEKTAAILLELACRELWAAREKHDTLELIYNCRINFEALRTDAVSEANRLLDTQT